MKIAICDSSALFMGKFVDEVNKINPKISITKFDGYNALISSKDLELFDSFFIATEIERQSGVDVALNVYLSTKAEVVFVTENCEKYSQSIFEYADRFRPFAMLNKPVSRLFLRHVIEMLERVTALHNNKSIIVRLMDKEYISLNVSDLLYIEHNNRVSYIYTADDNCYTSKQSIIWFEDNLPDYFIHCAKSCIVNASKITSVNEMEICISDKTTIWCSRRYKNNFSQSLAEYRDKTKDTTYE